MDYNKIYAKHSVFKTTDKIINFYHWAANYLSRYISVGVQSLRNFEVDLFLSIKNTIESIKMILYHGKIGDAYALLRRYHDAVIMETFITLNKWENLDFKTLTEEFTQNWYDGNKSMPQYRDMITFINESEKVAKLIPLFHPHFSNEVIRKRCNEYSHYNFYHTTTMNSGVPVSKDQYDCIEQFAADIESLFILHVSYFLFIRQRTLVGNVMRTDPEKYLREPNAKWPVDQAIQDIFNEFILKNRPDIAQFLIESTCMQLQ
jgi:hypothetical protein